MSTYAFVGIKNEWTVKYLLSQPEITGSYILLDSHPEGVGEILQEFWSTEEKLRELLALGNLSALGSKLNPSGPHSFVQPEKDVCIFNYRDRGGDLNHTTIHFNLSKNEVLNTDDSPITFYYLFIKDVGYEVYDLHGKLIQTLLFYEKDGKDTVRVWARVGMTIDVPKDQIVEFSMNMEGNIAEYYEKGWARFDGEIYLPEEVNCEQNDLVNHLAHVEYDKRMKEDSDL